VEDFERMQYRENQRQELLEELKRLVWNQINEENIVDERFNENCFYWGLITSATGYVHDLRLEFEQEIGNVFYSSALNLFKNSVVLKIEAFTPVHEERRLIATEFLKYAIEEMSRPIHQEILRLSVPPARDQFLKQIGLDQMQEIR
jgi:hypothetical protein